MSLRKLLELEIGYKGRSPFRCEEVSHFILQLSVLVYNVRLRLSQKNCISLQILKFIKMVSYIVTGSSKGLGVGSRNQLRATSSWLLTGIRVHSLPFLNNCLRIHQKSHWPCSKQEFFRGKTADSWHYYCHRSWSGCGRFAFAKGKTLGRLFTNSIKMLTRVWRAQRKQLLRLQVADWTS
jgi:hypothetical protein